MDVMAMAKATSKTALDLVFFLFRELRRLFFCLLLVFELLFIAHSTEDLFSGGLGMMVGWWWHVQQELSPLSQLLAPFDWLTFFCEQALILAMLGILWLSDRVSSRPLSRSVHPA
jgi:hypothetical protein